MEHARNPAMSRDFSRVGDAEPFIYVAYGVS
jgi:hypothetical protein